jgi:hypothetical protein
MDLTKWTRLWEKCAPLDTGHRYNEAYGWHRLLDPDDANDVELHSESDAADLIHARANTYLADEGREPCLDKHADQYEVTIWDREDDKRLSFYADSPVEAYYFACCCWLGVEP